MRRVTKTYVEMEISPEAYAEIEEKVRGAGPDYAHFLDAEGITLDNIKLVRGQAQERAFIINPSPPENP